MTIAEVSKKYNLSYDTIRYYERIGLIPPVTRNQSGIRDFTEKDCKWIEFIKCMRSSGVPVEALIEYVTLFKQGDETSGERKELLIEQRNNLLAKKEEIDSTLERLDSKIAKYEQTVVKREKSLKKSED